MGRPPLENKQRQLAVALPPETRSHLEDAAEAGDRSIAEEIRRRIDKTIAWEKSDPVTLELIEGMERILELLRRDYGTEWHKNPRAHGAFVAALNQRLAGYTPPPRTGRPGASDLFALSEPPETIGRMREQDDQRLTAYKHLREAQRRRARSQTVDAWAWGNAKKERNND